MKPRGIKFAIVGTGGMAHAHAHTMSRIKGCRLVAVADVDRARAEAFAAKFGNPPAFAGQDEMLKQTEVDAVINVTPDAWHAPLTLAALAAGKHVLCEKPLATCYADAKKMADAARRRGVINLVNFSYRNCPAIQRARALVARGDLGRPIHFEASYLQSWLASLVWGDWRTSPQWLWRLSTGHGSAGVLGDIGVHILDFAGYPLGEYAAVNCRLGTFDKAPGGRVGKYKLDANDSAVIHAETNNGALGVIHTTRWAAGHRNSLRLRIFGDEGGLVVDLDKGGNQIEVCLGKHRHAATWKTVTCAATPDNHQRFVRGILTGRNDQPDFARGAEIQKVLDACMASSASGKTVRFK
jgi:predicted dehydrogenase